MKTHFCSSKKRLLAATLVAFGIWACVMTPGNAYENISGTAPKMYDADCTFGACVFVGPRLTTIDSARGALLDAIVGGMLNSSVSLTAVDWQALAQCDLKLVDFANALKTELSVSTPETALATNATLANVLNALVTVAQANGDTAVVTALNALKLQVAGLTQTLRVGDFVQVSFPLDDFSTTQMNVLDFLMGTVELYNFKNVVTTPQPVALDCSAIGLDSVLNAADVYIQVVEPPVYVCGPVNTQFYSAAVRLKLDLSLVTLHPDLTALTNALELLLPGTGVTASASVTNLEMYLDIARAQGTITAVDVDQPQVTVEATPGVVNLYVGTISDSLFFNRTHVVTYSDVSYAALGSLDIALTILGNTTHHAAGIQAKSYAQGEAPSADTLIFSGPFPETQIATTGAAFISNLVNTAVTNLNLQLDGSLGGILDPLVNATILPLLKTAVGSVLTPPLTAVLTTLVDPLLEALGISLGEMYVTVNGAAQECPTCLVLGKFDVALHYPNVKLKWTTRSEFNLVAFNVWRKVGDKKWKQINVEAIPARNQGGMGETAYQFTTRVNGHAKTIRYRLELVQTDGTTSQSEIVRVRVP